MTPQKDEEGSRGVSVPGVGQGDLPRSPQRGAEWASFALASRAFDLFTLVEREAALVEFARLRYPSILERFTDAVHYVICESATKADAVDPHATDPGTLTPRAATASSSNNLVGGETPR